MAGCGMMRSRVLQIVGVLLLCVRVQATSAFSDVGVQVLHSPDSNYLVSWTQPGPVDVFVSAQADVNPATMRLLARRNRDLKLQTRIPDVQRPYFALRAADGSIYRTAERLLLLQEAPTFVISEVILQPTENMSAGGSYIARPLCQS